MSVNPDSKDIVATIEGQQFYFCAESCRRSFVENPKKFLEPKCDKPKGWYADIWQNLIKRPVENR